MTPQIDRYATARAVEQAIKAAAKAAHEADPTRQVDDLVRQAHYDRFLCRVFAAQALMDAYVGPIFTGTAVGTWNPDTRSWS